MYPDKSIDYAEELKLQDLKEPAEISENQLPVSAYAFLGDGVYGLMVREYLTLANKSKANTLHEKNIKMVNATFQAEASKIIFEILTDEEKNIFIRGRNTHTAHTPKNKSKSEYHAATALEVLFGWLYIKGSIGRLKYLFSVIVNNSDNL